MNLWQEVLSFAVSHCVWVYRVEPSATLASHGGIAALLARDEPQWGPATEATFKPEEAGE